MNFRNIFRNIFRKNKYLEVEERPTDYEMKSVILRSLKCSPSCKNFIMISCSYGNAYSYDNAYCEKLCQSTFFDYKEIMHYYSSITDKVYFINETYNYDNIKEALQIKGCIKNHAEIMNRNKIKTRVFKEILLK